MDVYVANVDFIPAPNCHPGSLNPVLGNISINQNMEMGVSTLLEFENPDVLRGNPILAFPINPQHRKNSVQINDGVTLNLFRIKSEREKSPQLERFRCCTNGVLISLRFSRAAVGAVPAFAIDSNYTSVAIGSGSDYYPLAAKLPTTKTVNPGSALEGSR